MPVKTDVKKTKPELIEELKVLRRELEAAKQAESSSLRESSSATPSARRHPDTSSLPAKRETLRIANLTAEDLVATLTDAVVIVDLDFIIRDWNSAAEAMYGWKAEEVIGRRFYDIDEFVDPCHPPEEIRKDIEQYGFWRSDVTQRRKDGTPIYVHTSVNLLTDGLGKPVGFVGINRNITERKKAEERFRLVSGTTTDLIYEWNIENDTLEWFGDIDTALDYNKVEIPRTIEGWVSLIHPDDLEKLKDSVERHRTSTEPISQEYRMRAKDGTWRYWVDRCAPLLNNQGKPYKWIGGCSDITEQKSSEDNLLKEKTFSDAVIESLPGVFYLFDVKGRFIRWNRKFKQISGYSPKELSAMKVLDFIADRDKQSVANKIQENFRKGYAEVDAHLVLKNGREIPYFFTGMRMNVGSKNYLVGSAIDISERKEAEQELRTLSARYEAILSAVPDIVIEVNENKVYTWANPAGYEFFGDDVIGKEAAYYFTGEQDTYQQMAPLFKGDVDTVYIESWQRRKDGQKRLLAWWCRALKDNNNIVIGTLSTARDITEQKSAEAALIENEKRFRILAEKRRELEFIINQSPAVAFLWKATEGWPVEYVSDNVRQFGYTPEDFYSGRIPYVDIVHPDDLERIATEVAEFCKDKDCESFTQEYRIITRDGGVRRTDDRTWIRRNDRGEITHYQGVILDITTRKQAEDKIRHLARLIESVSDAIISVDLDFNILSWNKAAENVYGWKPHEAMNKCIFDLLGTEHHVFTREGFLAQLYEKGSWQGEIVQKRKDGTFVDILASISLLYDASGKPTGMVGIHQDITDSKQARETLQSCNVHLVNAMRIAKLGNWEYDVTKDLFTFNDEFYAIFRTTVEKVGSYTLSSARYAEMFVHPEDAPVVGEEVRKAIEAKDPHFSRQIEHRMIYADGEVGYIAVRFQIVKDSEGRTIKTIGVNQDITERKRTEEALRKQSYELVKRIKEQKCLYSVSNLIGQRDISIDEICRQTVELIPKGWQYPEITCARIELNDKVFKTGNCRETEWVMSQKIIVNDKQVGYLKVAYLEEKPVCDEGPFLKEERGLLNAIAELIRESLERARAEEDKTNLENQLRHAQKMEAIGTLAGGIAHDFNNILMAMLGYAELVRADIPDDVEIHSNIDEILKAGKRAKDLVKQILAFSRQTEQEQKPVQPHLIVKEVLKLLRATLPVTIEIRQNIDEKCGAVMADPTQIHQVLMNLCTNARYAMRETGGVLTVTLGTVVITTEDAKENPNLPEGPYVKLVVGDTGHGMDQKTMERIFEPFYTTKPVGEGTGMGLATVHGIITNHGGTITVSSEPGKSSTFEVFLPLLESKEMEKPREEISTLKGSESVLFVDDEEPLAVLGKKMLERLGYHVTIRTNGVEALEAFRANPDKYDLVITDQTMPNLTGAELTVELLRIQPSLPIIVITGFSEMISPEKALQLGIRDFLTKPLVISDLGKAVRRILDEKAVRE